MEVADTPTGALELTDDPDAQVVIVSPTLGILRN
jgi:hypothetical protein